MKSYSLITLLSNYGVLLEWRVFRRLTTLNIVADINEPHPLPAIRNIEWSIQRLHFIVGFLIRSIIGNSTFQRLPNLLTNTHNFNAYFGPNSRSTHETQKIPPQNCLQRGSFMSLNSRKALFQAVFGHRKSPP